MRELEPTVCALLAAAQQESKAQLDTGWVDTVFKVGGWILQTKELLDAVEIGKPAVGRPLHCHCVPRPEHLHP